MRRFSEFSHRDTGFWATVRYISEFLGYSKGGKEEGRISCYTIAEIEHALGKNQLLIDPSQCADVKKYLDLRADTLNNTVKSSLMDASAAKVEFERLHPCHSEQGFSCKLPRVKQKGEMNQISYFTAIINILAERTIKEAVSVHAGPGFNDDPGGLVYVVNADNRLVGSTSRRYDGAYPGILMPKIVWEIKEYYYATTFGSRVADGVYETQLDGYEFRSIEKETGIHIEHVFFVDAFRTWWRDGKSYKDSLRLYQSLSVSPRMSGFARPVFARAGIRTRSSSDVMIPTTTPAMISMGA